MVQGQGQTTGQLQVIPAALTVIPAAGQQLMQAVLPNGQVQRFLFTPTPASSSTPGTRGFDFYISSFSNANINLFELNQCVNWFAILDINYSWGLGEFRLLLSEY